MDALFGLPRKKSAGKSVREPLHGLFFFFKEQQSVDELLKVLPLGGHPQRYTFKSVYNSVVA